MDNLTTEQKAQRYNEALERASKLRVQNPFDTVSQMMEHVFPELKESEDERIRKALIELLHDTVSNDEIFSDYGLDKTEVLAWLEKQVEKPVEEYNITGIKTKQHAEGKLGEIIKDIESGKVKTKFHEGDSIQFKGFGHNRYTIKEVCGLSHYINTMGNRMEMPYTDANFEVIKETEIPFGAKDSELQETIYYIPKGFHAEIDDDKVVIKKGKQKPTDNDMKEALRTEYEKGRADAIAEFRKEWSEEDESILQGIWDEILANKHDAKEYEWKTYDKFLDWLKSLKDRVQPKVELTQLDKIILEAAIAFVEHNNHFNCWRGVDKHTVLSALHSLRPQNTWKPSDEQMKALANALSLAKNCGEDSAFDLRTLHEQLKKLRDK